MKIKQLFRVEMSKVNMFKIDVWTFGHNYQVATPYTLYINVLGIITSSLKPLIYGTASCRNCTKDLLFIIYEP